MQKTKSGKNNQKSVGITGKKYTSSQASAKIKQLEQEIWDLKIENKGLKLQVNSKRHQAAVKIATIFNHIAPAGTFRNRISQKVYGNIRRSSERKKIREFKATYQPIADKIIELAGDKPIIIYDTIPYNAILRQRPHHLAAELAKLGYFVLWLSRIDTKRSREINKNIFCVNNPDILHALSGVKNTLYFFASFATTMEATKRSLTAIPKAHFIAEYIDEIDDDISGGGASELRDFWKNLPMFNPILLLASAKKLKKDLVDRGFSKDIILLSQNAANVDHFDFTKKHPQKAPSDLAKIIAKRKPIVGYYGAIAPWLDYNLINSIAKKHPEFSFVYIGIDYNNALENLELHDNVYFLGEKKYEKLSDYSYYFDTTIIPFRHGEIAKSTSPVKLFEYMAMGLPTVCTSDLTECRGYDFVFMSSDDKDFENNLQLAVKVKKDKKARLRLLEQAKDNTWAKRARDIDEYLKNIQK